MISRNTADQINGPEGGPLNDHNGLLSPGSQLDLVLSEVRRLEEMSNRYWFKFGQIFLYLFFLFNLLLGTNCL